MMLDYFSIEERILEKVPDLVPSFWTLLRSGTRDTEKSIAEAVQIELGGLWKDMAMRYRALEIPTTDDRYSADNRLSIIRMLVGDQDSLWGALSTYQKNFLKANGYIYPEYGKLFLDNLSVSVGKIAEAPDGAGKAFTDGEEFDCTEGKIQFNENPFDENNFGGNALETSIETPWGEIYEVRELELYFHNIILGTSVIDDCYAGLISDESFRNEFAFFTAYRTFINNFYRVAYRGATHTSLQGFVNALAGVPLVETDNETVVSITIEFENGQVIRRVETDKNVYKASFLFQAYEGVGVGGKLPKYSPVFKMVEIKEYINTPEWAHDNSGDGETYVVNKAPVNWKKIKYDLNTRYTLQNLEDIEDWIQRPRFDISYPPDKEGKLHTGTHGIWNRITGPDTVMFEFLGPYVSDTLLELFKFVLQEILPWNVLYKVSESVDPLSALLDSEGEALLEYVIIDGVEYTEVLLEYMPWAEYVLLDHTGEELLEYLLLAEEEHRETLVDFITGSLPGSDFTLENIIFPSYILENWPYIVYGNILDAAGETIYIYINGGTAVEIVVDGDGNFEFSIDPSLYPDGYEIIVKDEEGGVICVIVIKPETPGEYNIVVKNSEGNVVFDIPVVFAEEPGFLDIVFNDPAAGLPFTLTGTAENLDGKIVKVFYKDTNSDEWVYLGEAVVIDGEFTIENCILDEKGRYDFKFEVFDEEGSPYGDYSYSDSSMENVKVRGDYSVEEIDFPDHIYEGESFTLEGEITGAEGETIYIYIDGELVEEVRLNEDGTFEVVIDTPLEPGAYEIVIKDDDGHVIVVIVIEVEDTPGPEITDLVIPEIIYPEPFYITGEITRAEGRTLYLHVSGQIYSSLVSGGTFSFYIDNLTFTGHYSASIKSDDGTELRTFPVIIQPLPYTAIVETIANNFSHTHAVLDGTPKSWGRDTAGELGTASPPGFYCTPQDIYMNGALAGKTVSGFGASYDSTAAIAGGEVFTCGDNTYGQLGLGHNDHMNTFQKVNGLSDIVKIVGGDNHFIAMDVWGNVFTWGRGTLGALGLGDLNNRTSPVQATLPSSAIDIAAGQSSSFVVTAEGKVYSCGYNLQGVLGRPVGGPIPSPDFDQVPIQDYIIGISAARHAVAVGAFGRVYVWGNGANGRLGTGNDNNQEAPVEIIPTAPIKSARACLYNTVFLDFSGGTYVCGWNLGGSLCQGHFDNITSRVMIPTIGTPAFKAVFTGGNSGTIFGITEENLLYGWGANGSCELGLGMYAGNKAEATLITGV